MPHLDPGGWEAFLSSASSASVMLALTHFLPACEGQAGRQRRAQHSEVRQVHSSQATTLVTPCHACVCSGQVYDAGTPAAAWHLLRPYRHGLAPGPQVALPRQHSLNHSCSDTAGLWYYQGAGGSESARVGQPAAW